MKSTGHEKVRVTVCLTAAADGRKLKPMIVFKGTKRELILLNQECKGRCFIASSASGWMNEDLTLNFVKKICLPRLRLENGCWHGTLLRAVMVESVKETLNSVKVHMAIIPVGCTKHIQAPDVSWNKPPKAYITRKYNYFKGRNFCGKKLSRFRKTAKYLHFRASKIACTVVSVHVSCTWSTLSRTKNRARNIYFKKLKSTRLNNNGCSKDLL